MAEHPDSSPSPPRLAALAGRRVLAPPLRQISVALGAIMLLGTFLGLFLPRASA